MRARSSKGRMAQRGRGTLEVRESNNPFFQTTNKNIGMDLARNRPFDAPRFARPVPRDANDGFDFRFQYEQSSTKIGQGVHHSDSRISHTLMRCDARGDVARAKGAGLYPTEPDANASDAALATTLQPATTEETLAAYRHAPIAQHSMYTTTNNELGIKKPTNATFSNERAARSQNFSNSFNGVKHRNQGLNCAMTKSGAHKNLDPQWI